MLYKAKREIGFIKAMNTITTEVRKGARLVWAAVRSCYGKGYWINSAPWSNTDSWKNA